LSLGVSKNSSMHGEVTVHYEYTSSW
jgi:hypothetical protein